MFIFFQYEKQRNRLYGYCSEERNIIEHLFIYIYSSLLNIDCCTQILLLWVEYCDGCTYKRIAMLSMSLFKTRNKYIYIGKNVIP